MYPFYGNDYQNYNQVKLNNPLMGTEVGSNNKTKNQGATVVVKLNNPLMGTEVIFLIGLMK